MTVMETHPQKLALTSPTGGGRSVGIVLVRTKATEFSLDGNSYMFRPVLSIIRLSSELKG